ncbi:HD domain-containing protein [Halobacillus sp. A1]|uniref:HD domain-containing protein n=1 Tax=Halobacillus sp. A1 TaxID=2880262 RepID=UPI0020A6A255|nr:HD domain-containing protein [Halobacillus sp. A1]MCP3032149.1 HD domain-containing protein [Halobacillus sp. A1]
MHLKIKRIADTIHGNIQISSIEKKLISQHAFNRLHNIMQNSTAFLTYPSNQTKRFEHSLGVMHIGGEIFYNSVSNAEEDVLSEFMKEAKEEVQKLNEDNGEILRHKFNERLDDVLERFESADILDPLYKKKAPSVIDDRHKNYYYLVFQSIRCAALLHDLGHPPFSHVTESALNEVLKKVKGREKTTKRMDFFLDIMDSYHNERKNKLELHERIGNNIADRLFEFVNNETNQDSDDMQLFSIYVRYLTIKILKEENDFFKDIHSIIASPIDCDRLDYVTRDLINSGFTKGHIEYDRLLSSMKMIKQIEKYYFVPSVRTLSTIEDFYQRYVFLYKYVIFHHRVVKTDQLLSEIIYDLSMSYLEEESEEESKEDPSLALPLNISGLWKPIKVVNTNKKYFNLITQWDDAWLLTVLRQKFYGNYQDTNNKTGKQLEEILSNKKYYHSLIKRMDDFLIIDKNIIENIDIKKIRIKDPEFLIDLLEKQHDLYHQSYSEWKKKAPSFGFFYSTINKLFDSLLRSEEFTKVVENAIIETCEKFEIDFEEHVLVNYKKLKTGLDKEKPYLQGEDGIITLSEVSRIEHDLNLGKDVFPQIFIYILLEEGQLNVEDFLKDLGANTGKLLSQYFEEES